MTKRGWAQDFAKGIRRIQPKIRTGESPSLDERMFSKEISGCSWNDGKGNGDGIFEAMFKANRESDLLDD